MVLMSRLLGIGLSGMCCKEQPWMEAGWAYLVGS